MSTISSGTTLTTALVQTGDTTGDLVIKTGSSNTTAMTISGSDQSISLATVLPQDSGGTGTTIGYNGFKNRIINGAMMIDQRNAGASVTPNSSYTLDRWLAATSQTSKITVQQVSDAPSGFTTSLKATSSSAYSVLAGDYFAVMQSIEGYNIADFAFGSANASAITVSFWVKSSLTGTFGGSIRGASFTRSYPFTYTITSANTWEQKVVTVSGETSGTWLTTNGIGLAVIFGLGVGSTYSGTAGSWASANYISATGATSVVGTNGATFYITGVQLEKGSTTTSFDYRPYGTELALCQRYYEKDISGIWTNPATGVAFTAGGTYRVTKRATPTGTIQSATYYGGTSNASVLPQNDGYALLSASSNAPSAGTGFQAVFAVSAEL